MKKQKLIHLLGTLVLIGCISGALAATYIYHQGTAEYDVAEGTVNVYTTVTISANPTEGQPVTITGTLNPIREGIILVFVDNGAEIGRVATNSNGIASTTTTATPGHHSVTVTPLS